MGHISRQVGQKDVAGWGAAAMVCTALAIFSANAANLIPDHLVSSVHATRIQGGSLTQMRIQMADLQAESARISRDYRTLLTRFNLFDDDSDEVGRRLAAVERSLPLLIESLPHATDIDRSLLTASFGRQAAQVRQRDNGTVLVRQRPLFGSDAADNQPMPPAIENMTTSSSEGNAAASAVALGQPADERTTIANWQAYIDQAGQLLLGIVPLLGQAPDGSGYVPVAGPLADINAAEALCAHLVGVDIECRPVPYEGAEWPE